MHLKAIEDYQSVLKSELFIEHNITLNDGCPTNSFSNVLAVVKKVTFSHV
jgi:hypothetical protein